jgi:hypothetical protein
MGEWESSSRRRAYYMMSTWLYSCLMTRVFVVSVNKMSKSSLRSIIIVHSFAANALKLSTGYMFEEKGVGIPFPSQTWNT